MEESGIHSVLPSAQSIVLSLRYPFAKCSAKGAFFVTFSILYGGMRSEIPQVQRRGKETFSARLSGNENEISNRLASATMTITQKENSSASSTKP
jgi:hypothetical protein